MEARLRPRACAWVLGVVAVLVAAGCGAANREEQVSTAGPLAGEDAQSAEPPPATVAASIGVFAACDDFPEIEGDFGSEPVIGEFPGSALAMIWEYGAKHSDEFGELWRSPAAHEAVVVAFTGNIEAHRDALEALLPPGTPFDVVQVDHSFAELLALQESVGSLQDLQGLDGTSTYAMENRVGFYFVDPTDATLDRLAEMVPVDMVCLNVYYSIPPPDGPLDVIPLDSADDPPTECWPGSWYTDIGCENRVVLPPGLAHIDVHLDPSALPDPADASIRLLVTVSICVSGRETDVRGPQVVETDEAVLVAFAEVPYIGFDSCVNAQDMPVTVELSRPLGDRALLHGVLAPPAPFEPLPDSQP